MSEPESFAEHVRDAFTHLHELRVLRTHPLARLLGAGGKDLSGEALRGRLLAAVEQLKPPADVPRSSVPWRQYRYLHLRYVDGSTHEAIARDLTVSTRQARRDHLEGLRDLSQLLWESRQILSATGEAGSRSPEPRPEGPSAADRRAALDAELSKAVFEEGHHQVDLSEVVNSVVTMARKLVERATGSVEASVQPALPPAAIDRTILRQILLSLLGYAVGNEPGAHLVVSAAASVDPVELHVDIRSVGESGANPSLAGERPESLSALLAAAQHLADLHRVRLDLNRAGSKPNWIHVVVPAVHHRTVLVVDDNPDVARLFARFLRGSGYRLLQARTWQKALQLAREALPDVITLDVMMPSQDGWDVLQRLRESPITAEIPVVVCSVLPERSYASAIGAAGFLPKPVTRRSLLEALDEALGSRTPDQAADG